MDKQISAAAKTIAEKMADGKITKDERLALEQIIHDTFLKFGRDVIHDKLVPQINRQLEAMSSDNKLEGSPTPLLNENGFSYDLVNQKTQQAAGGMSFIMSNDPKLEREKRELMNGLGDDYREYLDYLRNIPRLPK